LGRPQKSESIRSTGIIEGTEVNLSPKVSGRLSFVCCNEGDPVKKGEEAFRLESNDLRASVDKAKAGVDFSRAEIRVSESAITSSKANISSAEADIRTAEADVEKARINMDLAQKEMKRAEALFKDEFLSQQTLDSRIATYNAAEADYTSSKSRLSAANARKSASEAQLNQAVNHLKSSAASLKESEANLSYNLAKFDDTVIASPISGTVVLKAMEKGETVSPGMTVLTIVDMEELYVRVDLDETLINSIALNSEALIRAEGSSKSEFRGTVSEIGRYAEFATQRDVTRGRQDIRTFRVKIRVGDTGGRLKPGMTVEVEIPKKR
ncbi:MAG TPA: efflux RND transporter periplasmic adaptor subunit, partial [Thermodesulfovibrionales bacterium]|nr:efflux RND transporter periplasmic adaptor subunit [Thermodesulfovibrionales bacterium]